MKKTLTVFSTLFAVLCLSAQTPEQSARIQEIKADETKYFYGESTSLINNADAFNAAIQDMSRQVKSTVDLTITEMNDRYDTESIIRSAAAFNNVNKIDYSTERNGQKSYVTFVYISKADYIKQLKESEAQAIERINNLIEEAIYQEGKVNIADALRNQFPCGIQFFALHFSCRRPAEQAFNHPQQRNGNRWHNQLREVG